MNTIIKPTLEPEAAPAADTSSTPRPGKSADLTELLDEIGKAEREEQQRHALEASTRAPRGAD